MWVKNVAGKRLPIDPEPVPNGNVVPMWVDGERRVRIATADHPIPDDYTGDRFVSHFATCPQADEWRKPKGRKR